MSALDRLTTDDREWLAFLRWENDPHRDPTGYWLSPDPRMGWVKAPPDGRQLGPQASQPEPAVIRALDSGPGDDADVDSVLAACGYERARG